MSRYWKIMGIVTFIVSIIVSVFITLQNSDTVSSTSNKPATSRYITN